MDSKLDTQIAVVYTAILSGGQIGGIISGFLGNGFYICNENLPNLKIAAVTVPWTMIRGPVFPTVEILKKNVGRINRYLQCFHRYQHYHY